MIFHSSIVQPQEPIFPPTKQKLLIVMIIIIVMLFFIIGVVSYYLGVKQIKTQSNIFPIQIPTTVTRPTQILTVSDEVGDWKIYKNDKYNYEIKYPKVWEAVEAKPRLGMKSEWTGNILLDNEVQKITFITKDLENFEFNFEVKVSSNLTYLSLEGLKNKILEERVASTGPKLATFEKTIKLDNLDALKFSIFAFDSSKNSIFAIKNNFIYEIAFDEENPNDPNFEMHFKIYNEMLSSFKFIE